VTKELQIATLNIETNEVSNVCSRTLFDDSVDGTLRDYDLVVTGCHLNAVSNRLVIAFANKSLFSVIDLSQSNTLYWRLPSLANQGTPLVFASDMDKLMVGYDTNHIAIFDLLNRQIHPWTSTNFERLPRNFLSRYNKFAGAIQVSESKYLLYTNYTFCTLDLESSVPAQVELVQNHPTKALEGKQLQAKSWFDNLKLSQQKYLSKD